jgi:hypothetical protein
MWDEKSASRSSLFTLGVKPPLPTVQEGVWNTEPACFLVANRRVTPVLSLHYSASFRIRSFKSLSSTGLKRAVKHRLGIRNFHSSGSTRLAQSFELVIPVAVSQSQSAYCKGSSFTRTLQACHTLENINAKPCRCIMVEYHHHHHERWRFRAVSSVPCKSLAFR